LNIALDAHILAHATSFTLSLRSRASIAKAIESIHAQTEALANDHVVNDIDHESVKYSWMSCFFEGLQRKLSLTRVSFSERSMMFLHEL
jgi:hypothetical protein